MNSELRSARHKKHMFYSHFTKNKNAKTWDKYRRKRNLVTKLKKKSMKNYFLERCFLVFMGACLSKTLKNSDS
jgi:hypothetical protein